MKKTSENVKFVWSEDMQTAFQEPKVKLTSAPVLAYADYEKPFVVCTDASSQSIGAVLSQVDENGRDHPMNYASRALSSAESNYSAFEREALGRCFRIEKIPLLLNIEQVQTVHRSPGPEICLQYGRRSRKDRTLVHPTRRI